MKRHQALQPVSRDHHFGLMLCWKIRQGFDKGVSADRMKSYIDWFYENHILPHFKIEEAWVFPILGQDHELVQRALGEHQRLQALFTDKDNPSETVALIATELEQHIRFEERVLFEKIQEIGTVEELKRVQAAHPDEKFEENTKDMFWMDDK